MSITVKINNSDVTDNVTWETLEVEQNLTHERDTASFSIRKYTDDVTYDPSIDDDVVILDDGDKIFGGTVIDFSKKVEAAVGIMFEIECVDYSHIFDDKLVSKAYENKTVKEIVDDIVANFTDGSFTTNNVQSSFQIGKMVFNQVAPSVCLKRLARLLNYDWYIDADKDIHLFSKLSNNAPFDIKDDSGNYIYKSLEHKIDGSQIVNRVKVRGGQYEGSTLTDTITVSGNDSKTFDLRYRFANLSVKLNGASQTVGKDYIDDFSGNDVLYNYQEKVLKFNSTLSDGDKIEFSGNPKVPVFAIAEDPQSINKFGVKEELIEDNSIDDLQTARQRAEAELDIYSKEIQEANFTTYDSGLRAGMYLNVSSSVRNLDLDFIIRRVSAKPIDPNNFIYDVETSTTTKISLTALLAEIIEPEPKDIDESEVAEKIKSDTQEIKIEEKIVRESPETDEQEIEIEESIVKDPLGADTEPTWVLADYFPSSQSDPKREGRLDISMKVY